MPDLKGSGMPKPKVNYQGNFDGLCGPYAITNALAHIDPTQKPKAIFRAACSAISRSRWPTALFEGVRLDELPKMIRASMSELDPALKVSVSYPFWRSIPTSNAEYWAKFDEIFDDETVACAIIGLTLPGQHWAVVIKEDDGFKIIDSDRDKPKRRMIRGRIHAGERRPKPKWMAIDRRELIVFRREI